ncbi:MAG TPA: UDP-N-acetylmuramoyl-L-alanine--D-glutamate ligase [Actinomycetota bacterium]|nr:UDP-N-acetylmuramoyl-L-alanine--D-glutamate ligase [Actinomycetota bacterium]
MIEAGRRVLILGLGRVTGAAVAEALFDMGASVRAHESYPTREKEELARRLEAQGARVSLGEADPELVEELAGWAEVVVPSPGVPPSNPLLAAALERGVRVLSEVELGFPSARGPVLAVTGTNGKTTTTSLLAEILQQAGLPAQAVGNIGVPFVTAARNSAPGDVLVAELSSFQLAFVETFRPLVAVVLNVAHDHYDWHRGYEDYLAAKARITENQAPGDRLVIRVDDPGCLAMAAGSRAEIAGFGVDSPQEVWQRLHLGLGRAPALVAGVEEGRVTVFDGSERTAVTNLSDIRMEGLHNLENVMAAALAALKMQVEPSVVAAVAGRFGNLPHRTELVATRNGVRYIDDSKATNPHATLLAMRGLTNVVLVAGGRAKGLDLSPLSEVAGQLSGLVVMGEAADEMAAVFPGVPIARAGDVEEAVRLAQGMARPGDTVLLSPACSSLDQYSDYAERGNRFRQAVLSL